MLQLTTADTLSGCMSPRIITLPLNESIKQCTSADIMHSKRPSKIKWQAFLGSVVNGRFCVVLGEST